MQCASNGKPAYQKNSLLTIQVRDDKFFQKMTVIFLLHSSKKEYDSTRIFGYIPTVNDLNYDLSVGTKIHWGIISTNYNTSWLFLDNFTTLLVVK